MNKFSLLLRDDTDRPVIFISSKYQITALLDTGAVFPIWTEEEDLLKLMGGSLIKSNIEFGGFGGTAVGNLYELPTFQLGKLIYPHLKIIACPLEIPAFMIIPATMFRNLIYEIDDSKKKLTLTVPPGETVIRNVLIRNSDGTLNVLSGEYKD